MGFVAELKRRNVFRVAVAYIVIAWLLAQVSDVALGAFGTPDWVPKTVLFLLVMGFPLAIVFAWAFELTPEGVRRERDVDRSHSLTRETGRKLDRVIIAVLAIAVGFLLVDKFVLQGPPAPKAADPQVAVADKSVAVLPFLAMSDGPDDEYFADGLTEEILNALSQLPELLVTARTSAFAFKGQDVSITEIAAKLGVAHVVEGSVRRAGGRLRVTAQLIRADDGFHLWSETYDRDATDSFSVQDEIAAKVATALDVVLDEQQLARMRSTGLRDPEAFVLYQKALAHSTRAHEIYGPQMPATLAEGNLLLEQALALAPEFSTAHFAHADYFIHYVLDGKPEGPLSEAEVEEALERAQADFRNAARTASTEAERLTATLELALVSRQFRRLPELFAAAAESGECIHAGWWTIVAPLLRSLEQPLALFRMRQQCNPLSFGGWADGIRMLIIDGDFQAAIAMAKEGLGVLQHHQIADQLVTAYLGSGQFSEALAASERLIEDEATRRFHRFSVAATRGAVSELEATPAEILGQEGMSLPVRISGYARIGDRDNANELAAIADDLPLGYLTLLEAVQACACGAPWDLAVTPDFASLLADADFIWPPRSPIRWPLKDW